jgi:hypothetical protein
LSTTRAGLWSFDVALDAVFDASSATAPRLEGRLSLSALILIRASKAGSLVAMDPVPVRVVAYYDNVSREWFAIVFDALQFSGVGFALKSNLNHAAKELDVWRLVVETDAIAEGAVFRSTHRSVGCYAWSSHVQPADPAPIIVGEDR